MYTKKQQNKIREYEIANFRKLKLIENKNRATPKNDDILYISDFDIKVYSKRIGDSGLLLLATNKNNKDEKYILKHEYYDCACNEYMYSKIGTKLGVKIAEVKLFVVDVQNILLKSDFVCGIKYYEENTNVNFAYINKNKNKIKNWEDYYKFYVLYILFEESDSFEVLLHKNNIYRIDMQSSFVISDYYIKSYAYDYNKNGINIRKNIAKHIRNLAENRYDLRKLAWDIELKSKIKLLGNDFLNYWKEVCNLLEKISDADITEWTNNITYFYPNIIGEYYVKYFNSLKEDIKKYQKELITI